MTCSRKLLGAQCLYVLLINVITKYKPLNRGCYSMILVIVLILLLELCKLDIKISLSNFWLIALEPIEKIFHS